MISLTSTLLVSILALIPTGHTLKPGDVFDLCKRNDPKLNECLKQSANKIRPKLVEGIPELKLTKMDPLLITSINIKQGSGPVSIDSTFTNVEIGGLKNYEVTSMTADLEARKIDMLFTIPYLTTDGNYTIGGKILVLPITGKGMTSSNYTDLDAKASVEFEPFEKNGKEFWKIKDIDVDLKVKNANIYMDNLFNGNKELGDAMNRFISENWEVVYKELKPIIVEAVKSLCLDTINKIFGRFSVAQLFP